MNVSAKNAAISIGSLGALSVGSTFLLSEAREPDTKGVRKAVTFAAGAAQLGVIGVSALGAYLALGNLTSSMPLAKGLVAGLAGGVAITGPVVGGGLIGKALSDKFD